MQDGLLLTEDIIVDAKSGVSGAGRSAKVNLLYTEIAEGINCYGVTKHRHMPEIEQARTFYLLRYVPASDLMTWHVDLPRTYLVWQDSVSL